ncbi:MAG: hypothetical protein JWR60_3339 [Polaromonas sp.]|nr:hypothetical protein [Polaromonas sp.]
MPKRPPAPLPRHEDGKELQAPDKKPRKGKDFGAEGTNKTIATPKPDGAASEELGNSNTPHIEKTPYIR